MLAMAAAHGKMSRAVEDRGLLQLALEERLKDLNILETLQQKYNIHAYTTQMRSYYSLALILRKRYEAKEVHEDDTAFALVLAFCYGELTLISTRNLNSETRAKSLKDACEIILEKHKAGSWPESNAALVKQVNKYFQSLLSPESISYLIELINHFSLEKVSDMHSKLLAGFYKNVRV